MGFKYKVQAYMLHSFADFAQGRSEEFVPNGLGFGVGSRCAPRSASAMIVCSPSAVWRVHLNAEDKRHQVPPTRVFGRA